MERAVQAVDARRALGTFGARDLARGRAYFAEGRVGPVKAADRVDDELLYRIDVRGSARSPYTTHLLFSARTGSFLDSECTCPIGGDCKHAVAALEALAEELDGPPATRTPATPRAPPLDPRVEAWLESLARAVRPVAAAAVTSERLVFRITLQPAHGKVDRVHVEVVRAVAQPDGAYAVLRKASLAALDWTRDPAVLPGDRELVLRLGEPRSGPWWLEWSRHGAWLGDVVATDRAFLKEGDGWLKLTSGERRPGELSFSSDSRGWQTPALTGPGFTHVLPFAPPLYLDASSGVLGEIEIARTPGAFAQAWLRGSAVSPAHAKEVARRLTLTSSDVRPPAPRVRPMRTITSEPVMILRLESELVGPPAPTYWGSVLPLPLRPWVRVFFDYEGVRVDPTADSDAKVTDDEILDVARSYDVEDALYERLGSAGFVPVQRAFSGRSIPPGVCFALPKVGPFELVGRALSLASAQVRVEKAADYAYDPVVVDDVEVGLEELPESIEHFAVTVGIRVGDETFAALPLVLAALRDHAPEGDAPLFVALPDGRTASIPAGRLEPLRRLLIELLAQKDPRLVTRGRAVALDPAVLARSPASLAKLRAALASPRKVAVPRSLKATLRGYQRDGFHWLMARRRAHLGAVLADDMGLGKTVQTLALLLAEERAGVPSLVVCPKSVLGNWEAETARFAPALKVHVHQGSDRASRLPAMPAADLVLTTYPILARDAELFATQRFSSVILDEAQTIKTASSTFTQAACALRADFRLALSGTPMENHLGELWSVLRFALPELLGDSRAFAKGFRRPIERDGSEPARRELVARIAPFVLRRRKEQVAAELPPKTLIVERIALEDAQRDVYETVRASMDARVRQALVERGIAQSHIIVLDALLKLRQAVCDPRLLPMKTAKNVGSAKLSALLEKLRSLADEGRRVLVFSQFVAMLELIQTELRREKIPFLVLTGQTENRADVVAAFQRGDAPVFLLSLKAGGTGLNLTAADVVIHYDPWWNPAAEAQATDRAHRIGQERPVLVYKLVGKETIEEKILALQEKKQALFTSIMDDGVGAAKKLTAADVEFLFAR